MQGRLAHEHRLQESARIRDALTGAVMAARQGQRVAASTPELESRSGPSPVKAGLRASEGSAQSAEGPALVAHPGGGAALSRASLAQSVRGLSSQQLVQGQQVQARSQQAQEQQQQQQHRGRASGGVVYSSSAQRDLQRRETLLRRLESSRWSRDVADIAEESTRVRTMFIGRRVKGKESLVSDVARSAQRAELSDVRQIFVGTRQLDERFADPEVAASLDPESCRARDIWQCYRQPQSRIAATAMAERGASATSWGRPTKHQREHAAAAAAAADRARRAADEPRVFPSWLTQAKGTDETGGQAHAGGPSALEAELVRRGAGAASVSLVPSVRCFLSVVRAREDELGQAALLRGAADAAGPPQLQLSSRGVDGEDGVGSGEGGVVLPSARSQSQTARGAVAGGGVRRGQSARRPRPDLSMSALAARRIAAPPVVLAPLEGFYKAVGDAYLAEQALRAATATSTAAAANAAAAAEAAAPGAAQADWESEGMGLVAKPARVERKATASYSFTSSSSLAKYRSETARTASEQRYLEVTMGPAAIATATVTSSAAAAARAHGGVMRGPDIGSLMLVMQPDPVPGTTAGPGTGTGSGAADSQRGARRRASASMEALREGADLAAKEHYGPVYLIKSLCPPTV